MTKPLTVKAAGAVIASVWPTAKVVGWVLVGAALLVYQLGGSSAAARIDEQGKQHKSDIASIHAILAQQAESIRALADANRETSRDVRGLTGEVKELVGEMRGLRKP